jgi:hypothetical protein
MEKISLSLNKSFYHTRQNDCGRWTCGEKKSKGGLGVEGGQVKRGLTIISTYVDLQYGRSHSTFEADLDGARCFIDSAWPMAARVFLEPEHEHPIWNALPDLDAA